MTEKLVEILYLVSSGLLAPTLVLLMSFLVVTLVMLGGLAREALDRGIGFRAWHKFVKTLRDGLVTSDQFFQLTLSGYPKKFQELTRNRNEQSYVVQKCLEDIELNISCQLARLTFATRLGPMLGLVGTLIPLGPALTGLAAGDIQTLSGNLVIAFTTTVFGILVGGFACAAAVIRRCWYEQDLSDLEFVATVWNRQSIDPRLTRAPHEFVLTSQNGRSDGSIVESGHA